MSHHVTGPGAAPEPDPERLQQIWHHASPAWRMQLPPYDDNAVVADPDLYDPDTT